MINWTNRYSIVFFLLFSTPIIFAQSKIEKLTQKVEEAPTDSTKADALNNLAWEYVNVNTSKGVPLVEEAIEICTKNNFLKLKSSCLNTYAYLQETMGNLQEAEIYYLKSIEEKRKIKDMKGMATVYSNVSKIYRRQSKHDLGISYLLKSISIQDSLKNYYGLGLAYNNLGSICKDMGDNPSAKKYHLKSLENRIIAKDSIGMAYSYVNIASVINDLGDYKQGIQYSLKGLEILERKKDYQAIILTLSNIANTYTKIKNFTLANKYNKRALDLALEKNNTTHLASIYQVKAELLMEEKEYLESLKVLNKALFFAEMHKMNFVQIEIKANIGACLYHLKRNKEAKKYLESAINSSREFEIPSIEFRSLCRLVDILVGENNLNLAQKHLKRAEILVKDLDSKKYFLTYYRCALNFAKSFKDKDLLLDSYDKYFQYRDSLMPENIHFAMSEASAKYETDKKNREIQLLRQERKIKAFETKEQKWQSEKRMYFMWALIGMLIIIITSIVLIYRKQKVILKQANKQAVYEAEEKERERLSKDIHDDLGSGLSKIRFLSESLKSSKSESEIQNSVNSINETAYQLVDNMRSMIWTLNPANNTLENLIIRIREYLYDYLEDYPIQATFLVEDNIPEMKIRSEASRHLFLVIKESLNNIVKHANASTAKIEVKIEDKVLFIKIVDNGLGFKVDSNGSGNGLKNMESRILAIGGKWKTLEKDGFEINLEISLEQVSAE
jgi:signal transduction histidine kinase